jgi:hypothetical protein
MNILMYNNIILPNRVHHNTYQGTWEQSSMLIELLASELNQLDTPDQKHNSRLATGLHQKRNSRDDIEA